MLPASKAIPKEIGPTIGANRTIVSGITIGEYALIGAGSVRYAPQFNRHFYWLRCNLIGGQQWQRNDILKSLESL